MPFQVLAPGLVGLPVGQGDYLASLRVELLAVAELVPQLRALAIDVSGRWPNDADIREVARSAVDPTTNFELSEPDVYDYLSRAALGAERLDDVFSSLPAAGSLPLLIAARLLVSFRPRGKDWWEYLDQIEAAFETAETIDLSVLPALTLRARRPSAPLQE